MPLRSRLRMNGKTSQEPKAATFPRKSGLEFSHSKTVTLGLGFLSLLSMRGSAKPVKVSL